MRKNPKVQKNPVSRELAPASLGQVTGGRVPVDDPSTDPLDPPQDGTPLPAHH
jgi:hypothetical protein